MKKKDVIIADDGGHLTWAIQAFKVKYGQKLFSAFGNSPMGYALPASIGASIVKNNSKIICIDGDGSIQINIQELQTLVSNKLPIKIIILNNDGYGIIKQFQELYLNKRYEAVDPKKGVTNPSFSKIAKAYGINFDPDNKFESFVSGESEDLDTSSQDALNQKQIEQITEKIKLSQNVESNEEYKQKYNDILKDVN